MQVLAGSKTLPENKFMVRGLQNPLDVDSLPVLAPLNVTVYDAPDISLRFNMNQFVQFFDGQFIAIWTQGTNEGVTGNHIVYATSADGETWSAAQDVTPIPPTGWLEGSAGLWERDGELWALYRHGEVGNPASGDHYYGPSLALRGNKWNGSGWGDYEVICDNCMLDREPVLLPTGKWYAAGRDRYFRTQMILGDIGNWRRILVPSPPGVLLNEPTISVVGDSGLISIEYRNEEPMTPRTLLRSFSYNWGGVISLPVVTNFPDGQARRAVRRLLDGRYILLSNASDEQRRKKLMLAVSDDGLSYDRVYILRGEETVPKWGAANDRTGYQYPQTIEKDGDLWIIYSRNKEDIQISRLAISDFI